jgi:hypothetical protein
MRAGLLSEPQVIQTINDRFVSTTFTYDDVKKRAKTTDELAGAVAAQFLGPVELLFFSPEGRFITKLTSVQDFTDIHPDTDIRPGQRYNRSPERNVRVFLKHVDAYFGKTP